MDDLSRDIERRIETQYGWLRGVEITVRLGAFGIAVGMAGALVVGLWQPSVERAAQWLLAIVLMWVAAHLLRSLFATWCESAERAVSGQ